MIYYYAMLLSTCISTQVGPLLVLLLYRGRDPLPDYHSIKAASPLCEWPPTPSLVPPPLFRGLFSVSVSLFPSSVIATTTRASASNWTPSPSPWVRARGAWGQGTDPHLPPSFLDFLPMKCLVLNYSHPTLIVIDWNSRGSGRMTDRLSSLQACPPRRRVKRRRRRLQWWGRRWEGEREVSARQCKVTHQHYWGTSSLLTTNDWS